MTWRVAGLPQLQLPQAYLQLQDSPEGHLKALVAATHFDHLLKDSNPKKRLGLMSTGHHAQVPKFGQSIALRFKADGRQSHLAGT